MGLSSTRTTRTLPPAPVPRWGNHNARDHSFSPSETAQEAAQPKTLKIFALTRNQIAGSVRCKCCRPALFPHSAGTWPSQILFFGNHFHRSTEALRQSRAAGGTRVLPLTGAEQASESAQNGINESQTTKPIKTYFLLLLDQCNCMERADSPEMPRPSSMDVTTTKAAACPLLHTRTWGHCCSSPLVWPHWNKLKIKFPMGWGNAFPVVGDMIS